MTRVDAIFRNTTLIEWFNQHKTRGQNLDTDDFSKVKSVLQREVDLRDDITSIFYGSAFTREQVNTGEYSLLLLMKCDD